MSKRARPNDPVFETVFSPDFTLDDVRAQIADALAAHPAMTPRGIEVSNQIMQMGFEERYGEIPVAVDNEMYPVPALRVIFHPEG